MDLLSLAGTLLLAAAQPQTGPAPQPVPQNQAQSSQETATVGRGGVRLDLSKIGSGQVGISTGKVHEARPEDFAPAPSADPTALLLPAVQMVRQGTPPAPPKP